jgi:hypothetical protein
MAGYNEKFIETLDEPPILTGHSQCETNSRTKGEPNMRNKLLSHRSFDGRLDVKHSSPGTPGTGTNPIRAAFRSLR